MNTGMKIVVYVRGRGVTIVAYVPTFAGVKPVTVKVTRHEFKQIMRGAKVLNVGDYGYTARVSSVGAALILMKIPDAAKIIPYWCADRVFKAAWRRSAKIRTEIWSRALDKVNGDPELARAYVRTWLKSKNREVPVGNKDAQRVSEQYWKLVWKFGASRYVIQVAPWE
jgi:hypothetical protein